MKMRCQPTVLKVLIIMIALFMAAGVTIFSKDTMAGEGEKMITVYNPQGIAPLIKRKPMAPRLDSLDGKTVYLVDVRFNDGDIFLQQMKAWFDENMPKVNAKFVRKSGVYTYNDKKLRPVRLEILLRSNLLA
ncbi:MAG: hypothetical protein JRJ85_20690 [Deltaproteobacteria bacterium]|nr:hypothetical protein [Deltaproteobacteria bacterium]